MLVSLIDEPEKLLHFIGEDYDFKIGIERIKNGFYLTNTNNFSLYLDTKNFDNITIGDQKVVDIKVLWDNYEVFSKLIVRQSDCGLSDNYKCKCDFCNLGTYGVSDNMEQVIKRYENYLINSISSIKTVIDLSVVDDNEYYRLMCYTINFSRAHNRYILKQKAHRLVFAETCLSVVLFLMLVIPIVIMWG